MVSRGNERRRFVLQQQLAASGTSVLGRPESVRCYVVSATASSANGQLEERPLDDLPPGEVLIEVTHSSLNYKDAMAASGHRGIVRKFPHVPGIDAAGRVVESSDSRFRPGDEVIATGREIGVERWGGWASHLRVPADWVQPVPEGLTCREAMILGTAGFTAAQCVAALVDHGVTPDQGEIVVTGATGGVGVLSLALLNHLGYHAVAVSGKADLAEWLQEQGATSVLPRDEILAMDARPLQSARWAGGVDAVGGQVLANVVRSTKHRGCVAACGVVGGAELPLTVYPFILRGVTLAGIDSAWCPEDRRAEIWRRLGAEWKPGNLDRLARDVALDEVSSAVDDMLAGRTIGRIIVTP